MNNFTTVENFVWKSLLYLVVYSNILTLFSKGNSHRGDSYTSNFYYFAFPSLSMFSDNTVHTPHEQKKRQKAISGQSIWWLVKYLNSIASIFTSTTITTTSTTGIAIPIAIYGLNASHPLENNETVYAICVWAFVFNHFSFATTKALIMQTTSSLNQFFTFVAVCFDFLCPSCYQ